MIRAFIDALRMGWRILTNAQFRTDVKELAARGRDVFQRAGAVRLLALLQERGRLVDFLHEDISGFEDAQVGAAVRSIHAQCRAAIESAVTLRPILPGREGEKISVPAGFDALAIKLEGHIGVSPPFRGVLRHGGWCVSDVSFPPLSPGRAPDQVAAAEVEVR